VKGNLSGLPHCNQGCDRDVQMPGRRSFLRLIS
jgi:hypothetical protein